MHETQNNSNIVDWKQTNNHTLYQKQHLNNQWEKNISNKFTYTRYKLWPAFTKLKRWICYILEVIVVIRRIRLISKNRYYKPETINYWRFDLGKIAALPKSFQIKLIKMVASNSTQLSRCPNFRPTFVLIKPGVAVIEVYQILKY